MTAEQQSVDSLVQATLQSAYDLQARLLPNWRRRRVNFLIWADKSSREPLRTAELLRRLVWTLDELCRVEAAQSSEHIKVALQRTDELLTRLDSRITTAANIARHKSAEGPVMNTMLLQCSVRLRCATVEHMRPSALTELARTMEHSGAAAPESPDRGQLVAFLQSELVAQAENEMIRDAIAWIRAERQAWVGSCLLWLLVSAIAFLTIAATSATDATSVRHFVSSVLTPTFFAMLGGTISVVRELRSRPSLGSGFRRAFGAQILVSGALGVLSLSLLQVGVLPSFQNSSPTTRQIQPVEAFDSTSSVNNSEGFFQL